MNKVVIFRFGTDRALSGDLLAMTIIVQGQLDRAAGLPFPGGMLNLVETEFSPSECAEIFYKVATEQDDILPVLAFDANSRNGYNFATLGLVEKVVDAFFKGGIDAIDELKASIKDEDEEEQPKTSHSVVENETCELELDELLDILNEVGGFEKLSPAQQQRLEFLTK